MPELAPELWILLPLVIAAGIDLYLTLLVLGAAPTLPWWDHPLPGSLGDLDATSIVVVIGLTYALEFLAERRPASALVWNAVHALIRPVSGALLAALLLHGQGLSVVIPGALVGGLLTSLSHAVRSGSILLRWLDPAPDPHPLLVSLLEDAVVVALVVLSLDRPAVALGAASALLVVALPLAPSRVRAFVFATRLAAARAFQSFRQRAWTPTDQLPAWVRNSLRDDLMAPGGGLRGARAGILRMPDLARFVTGWVVVRGDDPAFVFGSRGREGRAVELGALTLGQVVEEEFYRRVDLRDGEGRALRMFFFVNGPSAAALAAEFGGPGSRTAPHAPDATEKNL
jgi:hypothetical protein